jgi:hypothetical protein
LQFSGQYGGQYSGQYSGQYNGQYSGQYSTASIKIDGIKGKDISVNHNCMNITICFSEQLMRVSAKI